MTKYSNLRKKSEFKVDHPPLSDKGESKKWFDLNGITVDYHGNRKRYKTLVRILRLKPNSPINKELAVRLEIHKAYKFLLKQNDLNPTQYKKQVFVGWNGDDFINNKVSIIVEAVPIEIKST